MHNYRTSRALQEERLRQVSPVSPRSEPSLSASLRRLFQKITSVTAPDLGAPLHRRHEEGTA